MYLGTHSKKAVKALSTVFSVLKTIEKSDFIDVFSVNSFENN
jgi:hypothetical protein